MQTQDYKANNVFTTFAIGFFAGITPFAFTKVLPMMMHPDQFVPMQSLHVWIMVGGMLLTGAIVGIIITLMYAGSSDELTPKEVFLYALGIPAILVTTVSNFTTDMKAQSEISAMQDAANAAISSPTTNQQDIPARAFKSVTGLRSGGEGGFFVRSALAAEKGKPITLAQNQRKPYLVIIGTYTSKTDAQSAFDQFLGRKFRAEAYVTTKQLELLEQEGSPKQYVIVYARFATAEEATRTARYLMVNDRDLKVSLMKEMP